MTNSSTNPSDLGSGVTGGGEREISADLLGKEKQGKKGKWSKKKKENKKKGRRKIGNGKKKHYKWGDNLFFFISFYFFSIFYFYFILFYFFFCFSLLKTNEIYFGVYQNGNFLPEKKHFKSEKNQEKWICPLWKNIPLTPLPLDLRPNFNKNKIFLKCS